MARFELQKLYIDGAYSDAGSDATFEAINPANGEVLALVQRATKEDVERAVVSAEKGQKIWAAMTAMERSRILRRAVDILRERNDELAELERAVLKARASELGEVRRRNVRLVAGYGDPTTRDVMDDEARRAQARYDVLTRLLDAIRNGSGR